jgi:hypothetical protein
MMRLFLMVVLVITIYILGHMPPSPSRPATVLSATCLEAWESEARWYKLAREGANYQRRDVLLYMEEYRSFFDGLRVRINTECH